MQNEKLDDMMCEACELNFLLDIYLETGKFDEAYHRAQPLISRQVTCYEANLRAFLKLSYYAQKAGKAEIAADMCARAEEALAGREKDEYLLPYLGNFITYYFMTNPQRGWEYVECCVPWSLRTSKYKKYRFGCDMAEALKYESRPEVKLGLPRKNFLFIMQKVPIRLQNCAIISINRPKDWHINTIHATEITDIWRGYCVNAAICQYNNLEMKKECANGIRLSLRSQLAHLHITILLISPSP